jgi:hypothetical protein
MITRGPDEQMRNGIGEICHDFGHLPSLEALTEFVVFLITFDRNSVNISFLDYPSKAGAVLYDLEV